MYWLDTTLLALVALGAGLGLWSGFVWQVSRIASLAAAIYATVLLNDTATQLLKENLLRDIDVRVTQTLAYVLVFLFAYLAMFLLSRILQQCVRAADLIVMDRLLGCLLGAGKMALILAALCLAAASYQHPIPREWMAKSSLAPMFAQAMEGFLTVIPDDYKENLRDTLASLRDMMAKNAPEHVPATK